MSSSIESSEFNLPLYKASYESFKKLKKAVVKALDTQTLIDELKRRKIIHMNWETMKYDGNDEVKE